MSYYNSCDDQEIGVYNCDLCPTADPEYGRVRSVALIKKSYLATLMANPTTASVWNTGITGGNIVIVPMTAGSYAPGDQKEVQGFGDQKSTYGTREMTLTWKDGNYKLNYAFYNSLANLTDWVPAFRTSSLVHIFDKVATITGADGVDDDIESLVVYTGTAKVISRNLPSKHDASNLGSVFSCN